MASTICPVPSCGVYFVDGSGNAPARYCEHLNTAHKDRATMSTLAVRAFMNKHKLALCAQCDTFACENATSLSRHLITCHGCPVPSCKHVTDIDWTTRALLFHIRAEHGDMFPQQSGNETIKYYFAQHGITPCPTCGQPFADDGGLAFHRRNCRGAGTAPANDDDGDDNNGNKAPRTTSADGDGEGDGDSEDDVPPYDLTEDNETTNGSPLPTRHTLKCFHLVCRERKPFRTDIEFMIHCRKDHAEDDKFLRSAYLREWVRLHFNIQCDKCFQPLPKSGIFRHQLACKKRRMKRRKLSNTADDENEDDEEEEEQKQKQKQEEEEVEEDEEEEEEDEEEEEEEEEEEDDNEEEAEASSPNESRRRTRSQDKQEAQQNQQQSGNGTNTKSPPKSKAKSRASASASSSSSSSQPSSSVPGKSRSSVPSSQARHHSRVLDPGGLRCTLTQEEIYTNGDFLYVDCAPVCRQCNKAVAYHSPYRR